MTHFDGDLPPSAPQIRRDERRLLPTPDHERAGHRRWWRPRRPLCIGVRGASVTAVDINKDIIATVTGRFGSSPAS